MKLSQCKIGVLVIEKDNDLFRMTSLTYAKPKIGHVVGLAYNISNPDVNKFTPEEWKVAEVVPLVQFAGENNPRKFHHENLDLF
jgi:hypothetical protein